LGDTIEEFSDRTGIPVGTLKGYESGKRKPGLDALAAIGKAGANMNWLITGNGPMEIHHHNIEISGGEVTAANIGENMGAISQAIYKDAAIAESTTSPDKNPAQIPTVEIPTSGATRATNIKLAKAFIDLMTHASDDEIQNTLNMLNAYIAAIKKGR